MASNQKPQPNFNTEGQLGAEQMREQTRNAIDTYFGYLRQSVASMPSGGTDVGEKIKSYTEQNIAATHQFLTEVSRAKDFAELMSLQAEFMQKQISEFAQHAQRLGEAYTKSAASAVKGTGPTDPPRE
ncbi:MAG: phasin family protein [Xanthobacteraceae bacterium]